MSESRFQRWSRKKQEARTAPEAETPPVEPELSAEEQALAENEALTEQEVLEKYQLPDPEAIELGTDITGFMKKEIPEMLRRKALRALWRSNPVLAVLDGLNDYDEDFTHAATAMKGYQTIYKVGQGMVDRTKKIEAAVEELDEKLDAVLPDSNTRDVKPPELPGSRPVAIEPELEPESEPEPTIEATPIQNVEASPALPPVEDAEESQPQAPRYRPRMQFR